MGQRPGYKQSESHKAAIAASLGPHRGNWKGDIAGQKTGRQGHFVSIRKQSRAKGAKAENQNGTTLNNDPSNIRFLCRRCHMTEDGRLEKLVVVAKRPGPRGVKSKFTVADVEQMRAMITDGKSQAEVGEFFGIVQTSVSRLLRGKRRLS